MYRLLHLLIRQFPVSYDKDRGAVTSEYYYGSKDRYIFLQVIHIQLQPVILDKINYSLYIFKYNRYRK